MASLSRTPEQAIGGGASRKVALGVSLFPKQITHRANTDHRLSSLVPATLFTNEVRKGFLEKMRKLGTYGKITLASP